MKKSLKSLIAGTALLGLASTNTACLSPAMNRAIARDLAIFTVKEKISHEINPEEINVNVYNKSNFPMTLVEGSEYLRTPGTQEEGKICDFFAEGPYLCRPIGANCSHNITNRIFGCRDENGNKINPEEQKENTTKNKEIKDCIRVDGKVYCEK